MTAFPNSNPIDLLVTRSTEYRETLSEDELAKKDLIGRISYVAVCIFSAIGLAGILAGAVLAQPVAGLIALGAGVVAVVAHGILFRACNLGEHYGYRQLQELEETFGTEEGNALLARLQRRATEDAEREQRMEQDEAPLSYRFRKFFPEELNDAAHQSAFLGFGTNAEGLAHYRDWLNSLSTPDLHAE